MRRVEYNRLPVYPNGPLVKGELINMAKAVGKPRVRKSLADLEPPSRAKRPEALTSREQEILELIWAGFKNKGIGQRLKISVKTVEAHRANMMAREYRLTGVGAARDCTGLIYFTVNLMSAG